MPTYLFYHNTLNRTHTQTEETPEELNRRWIMLPDQPIKLRWDVAISMVCVLVSVLTPYRMAFAHNDAKSWLVFDAIVDVLFVVGESYMGFRRRLGAAGSYFVVACLVPVRSLARTRMPIPFRDEEPFRATAIRITTPLPNQHNI